MDADLLDEVTAAAEEDDLTVSAWITEAARDRLRLIGLRKLIDEWETEHGAFTETELADAEAWVDRALGDPPTSAHRRSA